VVVVDMISKPSDHISTLSFGRRPWRRCPTLTTTTRQPAGAVLDFRHGGTEIVAGARTEMTDAFMGYAAWCTAKARRWLDVKRFVDEMAALCKRFGIRIVAEDDCNYLMDVRLFTVSEGE
jgi:hypothetical protein